jgi:hypothetical protein
MRRRFLLWSNVFTSSAAALLAACGDDSPAPPGDVGGDVAADVAADTVGVDTEAPDGAGADAAEDVGSGGDIAVDTTTSSARLVRVVEVVPQTLPAVAPGPFVVTFEAEDFVPARDVLSVSGLELVGGGTEVEATACGDGRFCVALRPVATVPGHVPFSLGVGTSKVEADIGFFRAANIIPAPGGAHVVLPGMRQAPAWAYPIDFDGDGDSDLVAFEPTDPPPANGLVPRAPTPGSRLKVFEADAGAFVLKSDLSVSNPAQGEAALYLMGTGIVGRQGPVEPGPVRVETFAVDSQGTASRAALTMFFDGQAGLPLSVGTWATSRGAMPMALVHAPSNPVEPAPGALGRLYLAWEAPQVGGRTSWQRTLNYSADELAALAHAGTHSVAMAWTPPGNTRPADVLAVHVASLGDVLNPSNGSSFGGIHVLSDDPAGTVSRQWLVPTYPIDTNDAGRTLDAALRDLNGDALPDLVYSVTFGDDTWFSDYCLGRGTADSQGVMRDFAFDKCARLAENLTPSSYEALGGVIGYANLPGMCIDTSRVVTDGGGRWFDVAMACGGRPVAGTVTKLRIPLDAPGDVPNARPVQASVRLAAGDGNPRIGRKGGGMSVELVMQRGGVSVPMAVAADMPGLVEVPDMAPIPRIDDAANFGVNGVLRVEDMQVVGAGEDTFLRAAVTVPGRAVVQRPLVRPSTGDAWDPLLPLVRLEGESVQVVDVGLDGAVAAASGRLALPGGTVAGPQVALRGGSPGGGDGDWMRSIAIILDSEPVVVDPILYRGGIRVPGREDADVGLDVVVPSGAAARRTSVYVRPLDTSRTEVIAATEAGVWAGVHDDRSAQAGPTRLQKLAMPLPEGVAGVVVEKVVETLGVAGGTELWVWSEVVGGATGVAPMKLLHHVVREGDAAPALVLALPDAWPDGVPLLGSMRWPDGTCGFVGAARDEEGTVFSAARYDGQLAVVGRYPLHFHMMHQPDLEPWRNTDRVVSALVGSGGASLGADWNGDGFGDVLVPVDRWLRAALREDLPAAAEASVLVLPSNGAGAYYPPEAGPVMSARVPVVRDVGWPVVWGLDGAVAAGDWSPNLNECVFEFSVAHF